MTATMLVVRGVLILCYGSTSFTTAPLIFFFFFNDTATTEIYTLSLHDALPISPPVKMAVTKRGWASMWRMWMRSEEHTSELQSQSNLVCRLLLEKKKKIQRYIVNLRNTSLSTSLSQSILS